MADEERVKVLSLWASPYAQRVLFALELKGISYELVEEDLSNKSQLLLQSNPVHQKIPVLLHNDRAICESSLIVQYIDEAWPDREPKLLPQDPYARAQARFWADFYDNKLSSASRRFLFGATAEEKAEAAKQLEESLKLLDEELGKLEGPLFGGSSVNFTDVMLAPLVTGRNVWGPLFGFPLLSRDDCPNLHAYFDAIAAHLATVKALPPAERLEAHLCRLFPDKLVKQGSEMQAVLNNHVQEERVRSNDDAGNTIAA